MKQKSVFAILAILLIASAFPLALADRVEARPRFLERRAERLKRRKQHGADQTRTIKLDGLTRKYIVHFPKAAGGGGLLPLLIVLHGGGGTARGAVKMMGFNKIADSRGFIVVYPEGTGRGGPLHTWNAGNCCGYAQRRGVDDVSFIKAVIDQVKNSYPVDSRRIYATGISNGAMMAFRLGVELADQLAAIAPVAGAFNMKRAKLTSPVSLIMFNGTADRSVKYKGGVPEKHWGGKRVDKPVTYAVSRWVGFNGCSPAPVRTVSPKGDVIIDAYGGGAYGTEVVLYTLVGSGHVWPGGVNYGPVAREPDPTGISASLLIWDFFSRHRKAGEPNS